jgi:hypothetical protein
METKSWGEERESRRSLLRRGARWLGVVAVVGVGDLATRTGSAHAAPFCCSLAHPDSSEWCTIWGGPITCPQGYDHRNWLCCDVGARRWTCWECVTGGSPADCWHGTFACSGVEPSGTC